MTRRITITRLAVSVDGLTGRVDRLTGRVDRLGGRVNKLTATVDQLAASVDRLAAMVAKGFADLRREMLEGFASLRTLADDHSHRLDRIERKLDNTIERVDAHGVRIDTLEKHTGLRP